MKSWHSFRPEVIYIGIDWSPSYSSLLVFLTVVTNIDDLYYFYFQSTLLFKFQGGTSQKMNKITKYLKPYIVI